MGGYICIRGVFFAINKLMATLAGITERRKKKPDLGF